MKAQKNKKIKVIFTGGGTAGSVMPLLAVVDELRDWQARTVNAKTELKISWVGSRGGIERKIVRGEGIRYKAISSGKLRRYFSFKNFTDLFKIGFGFLESFFYLLANRPGIIVTAGSFIGVPVVWAGWVLRIPIIVHQLDSRPGLANRLMAPCARVVTVTFEKSLGDFGKKAKLVGNSVRRELRVMKAVPREARQKLGLSSKIPVVLVMGGGTGARAVNKLIMDRLVNLTRFCQIIHITGKGKQSEEAKKFTGYNPNYKAFEFVDTQVMAKAYAATDLVVSRCGMSTLTELSFLGKPAILIPMPGTHQEDNAIIFEQTNSAIVLSQNDLSPEVLVNNIKEILENDVLRRKLSNNIEKVIMTEANKEIAHLIRKFTINK